MKYHGHGRCEWPDGNVYTGNWDEGDIEGYGEYRWANGSVYNGMWKMNKF